MAMVIAMGLLPASTAQAQCCSYALAMQDSYGDGWNGGALQVLINGSNVGTFQGLGSSNDTTFQLCEGDQLELVYSSGDYENENTYQLRDPAGNFLFGDGPDPAIGTVFTSAGNCDSVAVPGSNPWVALPLDTGACVLVDNTGAGSSGYLPGCADFQGADRWFSAVIPPSGNVSVTTNDTGGLNDTGIGIWTGPDSHHLTLNICDDDGGPGYFSMALAFDLPAGDSLFIQAFGYGGGTGTFELCLHDLGRVLVDSSELPIVVIDTQDQPVPFDGKVDATMQVKYNGPGAITYLTDSASVYDGHIGIGVRGTTSAGYPQHPYNIETRTAQGDNFDVPLFGMPKENDWCLLSNYNDRSFVRNALAFELARRMGQYAPRSLLCEVILDSSYKGVYLFAERVKRDSGRVHIAKLTGTENSGDDLTGGYILEQNLWDWNNSFQSNYSPIDHPGFDVHFIYGYPAPDTITTQQRTYIAGYVDSLETALYSAAFSDPQTGYRRYVDVPSFINYFLVNELSRNNDGFKKSIYYHKDKYSNGGKLKAGPVWDFDWAWKDILGCEIFQQTDGSGWAHLVNDCPTDNYSSGWYVRLLQDSSFAAELRCTYDDYRSTVLDTTSIFAYIDSVGLLVQHAQERHYRRWPILGVSGPAPEVSAIATTYAAELDTLKAWIGERLTWLDANIPGVCGQVSVPELPRADVTLAPNPSNGRVHLHGTLAPVGNAVFVLRDPTGRELARYVLGSGRIDQDIILPGSGVFLYALEQRGQVLCTGRAVAY